MELVKGSRTRVYSRADVVSARRMARTVAEAVGLTPPDRTLVTAAVSELARNIIHYAGAGEILVGATEEGNRRGILVQARDRGPGIADVPGMMEDGFSVSRHLGLGLPGVRRMMDDFQIHSRIGKGTIVTVKKWRR